MINYIAIRREGQIFGITTCKDRAKQIIDSQKEIAPDIKVWLEYVDNLDEDKLLCNFLEPVEE